VFELAHRGTLFLDEIAEMVPATQVKLLRVLQERTFRRLGGRQEQTVDVRVIAATNQNPLDAVRGGKLREDLYYRLNVFAIELPPLRERREDIPKLVRHFLERFAARDGREVPHLDRDAFASLLAHDYPGNIRELENVLEGAAALSQGGVIHREDLQWLPSLGSGVAEVAINGETAPANLRDLEELHVQRVLKLAGGNKSRAARLLGISRRTLYRKKYLGH
jgi:transcriptional regulator with PAS, ATPase and Fis domain